MFIFLFKLISIAFPFPELNPSHCADSIPKCGPREEPSKTLTDRGNPYTVPPYDITHNSKVHGITVLVDIPGYRIYSSIENKKGGEGTKTGERTQSLQLKSYKNTLKSLKNILRSLKNILKSLKNILNKRDGARAIPQILVLGVCGFGAGAIIASIRSIYLNMKGSVAMYIYAEKYNKNKCIYIV